MGVIESEFGEIFVVVMMMGGCVGEMWFLKVYKVYKEFSSGLLML